MIPTSFRLFSPLFTPFFISHFPPPDSEGASMLGKCGSWYFGTWYSVTTLRYVSLAHVNATREEVWCACISLLIVDIIGERYWRIGWRSVTNHDH